MTSTIKILIAIKTLRSRLISKFLFFVSKGRKNSVTRGFSPRDTTVYEYNRCNFLQRDCVNIWNKINNGEALTKSMKTGLILEDTYYAGAARADLLK